MFRVAKMNMILTGDGHSNIKRQDSYEGKKINYAVNYGYDTKSAEINHI